MKNFISISTDSEDLYGSIDDGTNRLFINDVEVDSSEWVGTGNYTVTVEGHIVTIAKVADLNKNVGIKKTGEYTYALFKYSSGNNTPKLFDVGNGEGEFSIGDFLIQWGYTSITPSAANTPTTKSITFPKAFAYNPFVGVVARSSSIGTTVLGVSCANTSKTGTNLVVTRTNTSAVTVGWVAIGQKA